MSQAVSLILRETREGQNLSMNSLAAKAGLSQQMVSYVEREMRNPTLETLLRMTEALDIDIVDLFTQARERCGKVKKGKKTPVKPAVVTGGRSQNACEGEARAEHRLVSPASSRRAA